MDICGDLLSEKFYAFAGAESGLSASKMTHPGTLASLFELFYMLIAHQLSSLPIVRLIMRTSPIIPCLMCINLYLFLDFRIKEKFFIYINIMKLIGFEDNILEVF